MKNLLVCLFTVCLILVPLTGYAYSGPDDPEAIRAARDALKRLGSGRGAMGISGTSLNIVGLEGVAYSGSATVLNRDLADLGAEKRGEEIKVSLSGDVLFDFDRWVIKKDAEEVLEKLTKGIKDLGWRHVIIEGHTDSKGSESYNLKLSKKRAFAVKNWFVTKGKLTGVEYEVIGYGESRPVAPNTKPDGSDNPEGRAKNRRVEIRIKK